MRWKPEEMGTFKPNNNNIYTFAGRIREVGDPCWNLLQHSACVCCTGTLHGGKPRGKQAYM